MGNPRETNRHNIFSRGSKPDFRVTDGGSRDYLTSLPVPWLYPEQLRHCTKESIMERVVEEFDPETAQQALNRNEGKKILTIDFGGGKATKIIWEVKKGVLVADKKSIETVTKENNGANYMPFFQCVAKEANESALDVAISFGGPLEGTKPIAIPNASDFMNALITEYDGDFAKLFPTLVTVNNDAQAGIKAVALAAQRDLVDKGKLLPKSPIMFVINGGGIGMALLIDNQLIATEAGHVPIIEALNPHKQTETCGMLGRTYICLERIASGGGVQSLWRQLNGNPLDGKEISQRYQRGDSIARKLYESSAFVIAHAIIGVANIKKIMCKFNDTLVAFHGGVFRVPGLKERIIQIIRKERGFEYPRLESPTLFTDDISVNACAQGAAIAALMNTL